jgi:hypothetical protein
LRADGARVHQNRKQCGEKAGAEQSIHPDNGMGELVHGVRKNLPPLCPFPSPTPALIFSESSARAARARRD